VNKSKFSQKLITETIHIFREEDGMDLTPEQAELYLQSLAGLFLAFRKEGELGAPPEADSTSLT
jgi:hypothetical protein